MADLSYTSVRDFLFFSFFSPHMMLALLINYLITGGDQILTYKTGTSPQFFITGCASCQTRLPKGIARRKMV